MTAVCKFFPERTENRSNWEGKSMKQSTNDNAKGRYHELKGNVKEKIGRATNNRRLQAEGLGEKFVGKIQKAIGKAEKAVEKR
jgi:uncharacterized protein YjbJ (UPF0337 family)